MLKPTTAFSSGNLFAVLGWLCLATSLFLSSGLQTTVWIATGMALPALLGCTYTILLAGTLRSGHGGGFGTFAALRQLFSGDTALAAGWLHYLAFDLLVGTWIARAGTTAVMSPGVILPCLVATFIAGPFGLVIFLILRGLIAPHLALAF